MVTQQAAPTTRPPRSLADLVVANAARRPQRVVMRRRDADGWTDVTAEALLDQVTAVAKGLAAAGVAPGDRVGLMSATRYEWTLCDLAIWHAGAVTVPIYETSSVEQVGVILADSGAVACFLESAAHARTVAAVRPTPPALRHTWVFESSSRGDAGRDAGPDTGLAGPDTGLAGPDTGLADLVEAGRAVPDAELDGRRAALGPETLATIIYTSGTTGRPKGCQLTHGNFLAECTAAVAALPELFEPEDAATLLFLPLAHVFGRMIQVAAVLAAVPVGHSDVGRLPRDLPTFRPTFVLAVPRVFEKVFDTARRKAAAAGRERVFDAAARTAIAYSRALEGRRPGALLRIRRVIFDRLVYTKLRAAFGGRTTWAVSGGAPLGERLGHFFRGAGVTVLEGYGLTETTAACTVNTRAGTRVGTVGRALPGFAVRIAPDGEVQVRGGHVFAGYWGAPEATASVVTADGWFRTGDLGSLDAEGYLTITGRAKEVLVLSSGKNVAPAGLEDRVRAHPLVSQVLVVGDGRAQTGALVTLDADAVGVWLQGRGLAPRPVAELVEDPAVLAEVQTAVAAANASVSDAEAIKRVRVLPVELTEAGGQLTPTLKIKRAVVTAQFAAEIERLYAPRR
jgi:long-chain acyl-CoA synthetase